MTLLVSILQSVIAICAFGALWNLFARKLDRAGRILAAVLALCALFLSLSAASTARPKRTVTITALQEKNEAAKGAELTLSQIEIGGEKAELPEPVSGQWTWYKGEYRWFEPGDERLAAGTTESVTFVFFLLDQPELVFAGNAWKGMAAVEIDGQRQIVDTYREENETVRVSMPALTREEKAQAVMVPVLAFGVSLLTVLAVGAALFLLARKLGRRLLERYGQRSTVQRLMKYRFLFEELVSRDFKKKYKRTALGMAWSVLSPLLTLLVMRLVFTQFFGRTTPHYTIYLFCGNLIYSYFNEATSQGMTALVGNAGIFTKVNVPKYLFLFSKNVQTLINFGLTICVLFIFCVIDNITFTWRFVCLLYPIVLLLLFNIGVGLILSALFVFFKDIQYLWSVFTLLLMYMSAIFYTIDSYPAMVRNLFLLNPVYLFIRYFRKIVIEATVPTVWFHLLMLADAVVVLAVGCWMYKKYNHKFLYYV